MPHPDGYGKILSSNLSTQTGHLSDEIKAQDFPLNIACLPTSYGNFWLQDQNFSAVKWPNHTADIWHAVPAMQVCSYLPCYCSHSLLFSSVILPLDLLPTAGKLPSPRSNLPVCSFPLTVSLLAAWPCTLGAFIVSLSVFSFSHDGVHSFPS